MSECLAFDRVKSINDKHKHLVSGYMRKYVGLILDIPESIILVILLFYYDIIGSSILTDKENDILLSLFEKQNKFQHLDNYSYNLIYKRTRDGLKESDFKSRCHDKKNLLCILLDGRGNVFGGYTSIGWQGGSIRRADKDHEAFLFTIRSTQNFNPEIFNADTDEYRSQIIVRQGYYCWFGEHAAIWLRDLDGSGACNNVLGFEKPSNREYLNGTDWIVESPKEVEVFQLA